MAAYLPPDRFAGGVTNPLEAEQLYTNEFVPAGDEFIPPQTGPDKT
jgi:hypothetical protein